jgi:uncharacterized protein (TIGR02246 family)
MMIAFRKTVTICGMVVGFVLGGINSSAADPAAEVAAIHAVDQVWVKAVNAGDVETVAGLYDEHAVLLPPGAPAAHGRAAIRAFLAKDMAASAKEGVTFHLGPKPDGGVSGDMGWASGTYTVTDKSGHVVDSGKYLSVSRKKDGKWLYVRDTWNSDGPPAPAQPAAPAKK